MLAGVGMDTSRQDEVRRAYSSLEALWGQLPKRDMKERWADEYNEALTRIGNALGIDLSEYLVPDEYRFWVVASISGTGEKTYRGDQRLVDEALFRAKFQAALNYLRLLMPEEDVKRIGF